ncbi:MAG: DNA-directed RNA polymerase subunit omega [Clostridia bacterium]|nr:DNA-directed RNA polymerase subunit omega [Clostridia bacterium]
MADNKMFNPDLRDLLVDENGNQISRYSLVTATAKLAREISDEACENHEIITEKPVSTALDKLLAGEYTIEEPAEIKEL